MEILHHYGSEFNENAAREIVPYIVELFNPKSVIDVGAGIGTWARVFKESGVASIICMDGDHVPREQLRVAENEFRSVDLSVPSRVEVSERMDLCISLEVAEHLPAVAAKDFVALLCRCSDIIVFSAAIPGQTGENHINEQWPNYWVELLGEHGYQVFDPFRRRFWNNSKVEWWYRQNMLLALAPSIARVYPDFDAFDGNTYVHPELLTMYVRLLSQSQSATSGSLVRRGLRSVARRVRGMVRLFR